MIRINKKAMIGILSIVCGIVCFIVKANLTESIDSQGILHENFYLLPIGYFLIFVGIVIIVQFRMKNR